MSRDSDSLTIGSVIDFSSKNERIGRRRFLKALGVFGAGTYGLKQTIGRVYGEQPEGEPLVLTMDLQGNPKKVQIVPKERYRRLMAYKDFPIRTFKNRHPIVRELRLVQRSSDPSDLGYRFITEEASKKKEKLPSQIDGIPVKVESVSDDQYNHGGDCSAAHEYQSPIEGGLAVNAGGSNTYGTSTLVVYSGSTYPAILTADHVMDGDRTMEQGGRKIGEYKDRSLPGSGMDVTKYKMDPGIDPSYLTTFSDGVPTVDGKWTFEGLSGATGLECEISGATTCVTTNWVYETVRGGQRCEYQVNFRYRQADGGDSGGPWVDSSGNLVAVHSGWVDYWNSDAMDAGGAAAEALDAVGARLSP